MKPALRWLAVYGATTTAMLVPDAVWLGLVATSIYQRGIGHLMAAQPNLPAALAFYLLYPVGVVVLAVLSPAARSVARAAGYGAVLGLVAYGTYDLTNLATLRDWPLSIALVDMAWGGLLTAFAAAAGRAVANRLR